MKRLIDYSLREFVGDDMIRDWDKQELPHREEEIRLFMGNWGVKKND